jgi:hypothetical protein
LSKKQVPGLIKMQITVSRVRKELCRLTLVEKLASINPRLMRKTPGRVIFFRLSTLAIRGFTKMLPLQVRPLPMVPISDTNASLFFASWMLLVDEV